MHRFYLFCIICLWPASTIYGQKLVEKPADAGQLELKKAQFIGHPLTVLLDEIAPPIKFVSGNPENRWAGANGGTYLDFYFVSREEYHQSLTTSHRPIHIVVTFQLEPKNTRPPLPGAGLKEWTRENKMDYGDMIITRVRVTGGD